VMSVKRLSAHAVCVARLNVKKLRVVTIRWGNSATVFVMEMRHVFCEPGTEYTTIDYTNEY
jgi:hypothetical protein